MTEVNNKHLTIRDIAAMANVSVATVSRVINDTGTVKEETRQRVLQAMADHNYKPNSVARSLSTRKSKLLGCVLPDISNPFFSAVFLAAEIRALERGYNLLLSNTMNNAEVESTLLQSLYERQVEGLFLLGGRVNESQPPPAQVAEVVEIAQSVPVVMINGELPGTDCYRVSADEAGGITTLVNYLTNLGHRDIALVGGFAGNTSTEIKQRAFQQAMAEKGFEVRPERVVLGGWSVEEGAGLMRQVLQGKSLPTAIMAINDLAAIGVIQAAYAHGLRVPDDISVAGFDDTFLAEALLPRLTSVSQNYTELGPTAVDVMIAAINNEESPPKETVVATRLMIRESCQAVA